MENTDPGERHSTGTGSLFPDPQNPRESDSHETSRFDSSLDPSYPSGQFYTIGEVVSTLREDFPALSVSKVRYLERRRLLNLERTDGGYRLFRDGDIELLRHILTLQEEDYLPLEVIKQRIDSGIIPKDGHSPGGQSPGSEGVHGEYGSIPGAGMTNRRVYSKEELCREAPAEPGFLEELISVGVVGRKDAPGTAPGAAPGNYDLDDRDLEITRLATEMAKYSIQPRHLRGIVAAVDREVAMFKQVLNPELRSGDDERVASAMKSARELASADSRLKDLIMSSSIESLDNRQHPRTREAQTQTD